MAMIKCPVCGREISDKATVCIGCATPMSKILEAIQNNQPVKIPAENNFIGKDEDVFEWFHLTIVDKPRDVKIKLYNVSKMIEDDGFILYFEVENRANEARKIYLTDIKIDGEVVDEPTVFAGIVRANDEMCDLPVPFYGYSCDTCYDLEFNVRVDNCTDKPLLDEEQYGATVHFDFTTFNLEANTLLPNADFRDYQSGYLGCLATVFGGSSDSWLDVISLKFVENLGLCYQIDCTKEQIRNIFGQDVKYGYKFFFTQNMMMLLCTPYSIVHNGDASFVANLDKNYRVAQAEKEARGSGYIYHGMIYPNEPICPGDTWSMRLVENGQPCDFMCLEFVNVIDSYKLIANGDDTAEQIEQGKAMLNFLFADDIQICEWCREEIIKPYED